MQEKSKPAFWVFDTESTGIDVENDRIVQIVAGLANRQGEIIEYREWFINPGIPVPKEASDVHGFSDEFLQANGSDPAKALQEFDDYHLLNSYLPLVAYNASFDISMMHYELVRHGVSDSWGRWVSEQAEIFDPYVVDRAMDKYRKGGRKLLNVAEHYRIAFDPDALHNAKADVELTAKVAVAVRNKFGRPSNEEQARMHKNWAKGFKVYLARQGKPTNDVSEDWPLKKASA